MSFLSVPLPTALRASLHFYSSRPFQREIYYGALCIVRNIIIDISHDVLCIYALRYLHMNQCVRERALLIIRISVSVNVNLYIR